jgi:hypothetical protein
MLQQQLILPKKINMNLKQLHKLNQRLKKSNWQLIRPQQLHLQPLYLQKRLKYLKFLQLKVPVHPTLSLP